MKTVRALPESLKLILLRRLWLSDRTYELSFTRPEGFEFIPGQQLRLHDGPLERDYSLVSAPHESELRLCIRLVEGGAFTTKLARLETGAEVLGSGPLGYFTYRATSLPAVFIATGTGIAPFVSMTASGVTDYILLHGVPTRADLYYRQALSAGARSYVACLSVESPGAESGPGIFYGRTTDYVRTLLPSGRYHFYLCGRGDMIRETMHLIDERFEGSLVHTETYY